MGKLVGATLVVAQMKELKNERMKELIKIIWLIIERIKNPKSVIKLFLIPYSLFLILGCETKVKVLKDNPDNGEINFSIDETLRPFIDAQLDVFSNSFPRTKINRFYKTQNECISDLVNDSSQLICIGRALDSTESKILLQNRHILRNIIRRVFGIKKYLKKDVLLYFL